MDSGAYWDARYAGDELVFGAAPNLFLEREAARLAQGARVLAVADGEGRNGVWLARQGLSVHAIDASERALQKARGLAAEAGVTVAYELADLRTWSWPEARYDAVVAIFIQFAGPELRARLFAGMKRALAPGGLLLMEGYRPEQLAYATGGPPCAENMYDEAMLRAAFADLEIVELNCYDAALSEGPRHSGVSALIDIVARKPA
jgi:cyclopropane fatty-acyl-phospholipid synthase-like methyltransferase